MSTSVCRTSGAGTVAVAAAKAGIVDGSLKSFRGPLADQSGAEKVSAGSVMTDDEIWNMSWFVKGVVGSIPN